MKHEVPHDLDRATAKLAAQKAWETYSARFPKYDPQASWTGDHTAAISFAAKGVTLKGSLEILPSAIAIDLGVPLLLRPFQKKAFEVIDREIKKWIEKAKAGEL